MSPLIESMVGCRILGCKSFSLRIWRLWFIVVYLPALLLRSPMLFLIPHLSYVTAHFSLWKCVWSLNFKMLYIGMSLLAFAVPGIWQFILFWIFLIQFFTDHFLSSFLSVFTFWNSYYLDIKNSRLIVSFWSLLSYFPSPRHFVLLFWKFP